MIKRLLKAPSFWAFSSYMLISIVYTYPMIFNLDAFPYTGAEAIPPGSDIYYFPWGMWWFKYALTNSLNPFWTNHIFYPFGISLLFTLLHIFWSVVSLPLQLFLDLMVIYNLFFLASLVIGGMGAFLMIRYITKSSWGGFIGGVVFAFAPFHFAHIGHMTVFSVQWIPFFILYFLKLFDEEKWKNAIFAGLFLAFNCYSDLHFVVFLLFFAAIFIIYQLKYKGGNYFSVACIKRLGLGCLVFIVITAQYIFSLVRAAFSGGINIRLPIQHSVSQSADLLSFFVPSFMHPVFSSIVRPFYEHITTYNGYHLGGYIEVTAFVGFTTIALVIIALRNFEFRNLRLWIIVGFVFFLLTLGPVLKVGGLIQIPADWMHLDRIAQRIEPNLDPLALEMMKKSIGIPLPYLAWHFIPILSGSESAARFDIMFVLSWAVLCGFGVKYISERPKNGRFLMFSYSQTICLALLILILFEYAPFPIKMIRIPIPVYYNKLKNEVGDFAVMVLPILNNGQKGDLHDRVNEKIFNSTISVSSKQSMYIQTLHHKRILNGSTDRPLNDVRDFIENNPAIRLLAYPQEIKKEVLHVDLKIFKERVIKYIILQRVYLSQDEFNKLNFFLSGKFREVFNDNEIVVFQTYI